MNPALALYPGWMRAWRDHDDKIWDALLRQAEANLEASSAVRSLTQRVISDDATAMDRLAAWYRADGDAEDIASIAGQIAQQVNGKQVVGTKR